MKEFIKSQKVTYNLMSFTGFKSLLIFSILTEGPKSFEEIGKIIEENPYLKEKMSTDTMRVYMNSLKYIGCKIKRIKNEDKISRYYIESHPFELNLTDNQLKSVINLYKILVKSMDIKDLLYMDNLLEKIGRYIKNEDFINEIKSISMLNHIDKSMLKELIDCCDKKLQIIINYNSPKSGHKNIEVVTDKVEINNGKIYLCGLGLEYKEYSIFPLDRINKIIEIKNTKSEPKELQKVTVTYELSKPSSKIKLADNEKIINKKRNKTTIEITSSNEFLLRQKFLELGPSCKIIKPDKFKNDYINTLKDMKARYYCD